MEPIKNRYDFVFYFDVKDGNPNGDPDAGNLPRIDAETGNGLVTDVCIKRKVRNYVLMTKQEKTPFDIFIKEKAVLNNLIDKAHEDDEVSKKEKVKDKTEAARMWMCKNYYDVRTFGAVMSTGKNAGQVRGPIQLTFARSVDPIVHLNTVSQELRKPQKKDQKLEAQKWGANIQCLLVYIAAMVLSQHILQTIQSFLKKISPCFGMQCRKFLNTTVPLLVVK